MIGISLHSRRRRGRPRSRRRRAARGRRSRRRADRTRREVERLRARSRPASPRSRRRAAPPAAPAGSAARRRRRARAAASRRRRPASAARRRLGTQRQLDDERRALPGQRLDAQTRPPLASTKPRAIARPRPEPRWPAPARCRRGRTARRRARAAPAGCPGPRSTTRTTTPRARRAGAHGRRARRRSGARVLEQVREARARAGRRRRARSGRSRSIETLNASGAARRARRPPPRDDLVDRAPLRARLGARRPRGARGRAACRSSRARRRASLAITAGQLAPLLVVERRRPRAPRRRPTIAVSGERRSWETARSSAVLTTSLRRSARGLDDVAEQLVALERRAEQRLERRARPAPGARRSVASGDVGGHEQRADLARPVAQREGDAPLVALDRRAARSPPRAARAPGASRCAAVGSAVARSSPRSSSRASSAARSASRRRCSASARPRAREPRRASSR